MLATPPGTAAAMAAAAPDLHALPAVAQRALLRIQQGDVAVGELAELIGTDQALAAGVLRRVNSGHAMLNRRIASLREAVARVGVRALWEILVHASAEGMLDRGLPPYALPRRLAWRHAGTTSLAARQIAFRLGAANPEEASVAGLLHDCGKNALSAAVPEVIAQVVSMARSLGVPVYAAEEALLGFDHGAVGAALLGTWQMPPAVVAAVEHHHRPSEAGGRLSAVVHLADIAAHDAGAVGGGAGACPAPTMDPAALALLGLADAASAQALWADLDVIREGYA